MRDDVQHTHFEDADPDVENGYLVIGVYAESHQRYADHFPDAISVAEAESLAEASAFSAGEELIIAATIVYEAGTLDDMEIH